MGEPPVESLTTKPTTFKTTLDVSLTMALITAAEYLDGGGGLFPKLIRVFAPLIGLITSSLVTYLIRQYEFKRDEELITNYLQLIETRLNTLLDLSEERRQALHTEYNQLNMDLMELHRLRVKQKLLP